MHLLLAEQLRPQRSLTSTVLSVILHAGAIVLLATTGQQVVERVRGLIEESVQVILPVDREMGPLRPGLASQPEGGGAHTAGPGWPTSELMARGVGSAPAISRDGAAYTPWPSNAEQAEPALGEGTYSQVDVDSIAIFDPASAAPEYPAALVARNIEGKAVLRFEVDSTGLVDLSTARVLSTTHSLFARAVFEVLPRMKFRPARIGERTVRQLVDMPFIFKIEKKKVRIS